MSGKYVLNVLLFIAIFRVVILVPPSFPPCNQPLEKTVRVDRGENVLQRYTLFENIPCMNYWNAPFMWLNVAGDEICSSLRFTRSHYYFSNEKFLIKMKKEYYDREVYGCQMIFEMNIIRVTHDDHGIYTMKCNDPSCTILRLNVIVRIPEPFCTTNLEIELGILRLSCELNPRQPSDTMDLMARNNPLQTSDIRKTTTRSKTLISTSIAIQNAFDENRVPNECVVSYSDVEFDNQCNFPVFMSPSMNEVTENGGHVSFICCTNNEDIPSLWFYDKNLKLTPHTAGQVLMLDLDSYRDRLGDNASVVLICGEGDRDGRMNSFRMGNILFGSQFNTNISLKADIERIVEAATLTVSNGGSHSCTHAYNVSVIATYTKSKNEFITERTLQSPEVSIESSSLICNTPSGQNVPETNDSFFDIPTHSPTFPFTYTDETEIPTLLKGITQLETNPPFNYMIVLFVLAAAFVFPGLILGICFIRKKKHAQEIKRNHQTGGEGFDTGIELTSPRRREAELHEVTTMTSDSPRLLDPENDPPDGNHCAKYGDAHLCKDVTHSPIFTVLSKKPANENLKTGRSKPNESNTTIMEDKMTKHTYYGTENMLFAGIVSSQSTGTRIDSETHHNPWAIGKAAAYAVMPSLPEISNKLQFPAMINPVYQNCCKSTQGPLDEPEGACSSADDVNPTVCDGKSLREYENCFPVKGRRMALGIRTDNPSMKSDSLTKNERVNDNDRLAEEQNVYMDLIKVNSSSEPMYQSLKPLAP